MTGRQAVAEMTPAQKREAAAAEYRKVYGYSPNTWGWARPPEKRRAA